MYDRLAEVVMSLSVLLVFLFPMVIAAEVSLVSSVEQDGRTATCPGELVTFTCTVTQGVSLNWASIMFSSCSSIPTYLLVPGTSPGSISVCGSFSANLSAITNLTQVGQSLRADLTSTLSPTTTVSPGTVVTCSDLLNPSSIQQSKAYPNLASLPSSPKSPTVTVQHRSHNMTVEIQWDYPQIDGGATVDNYNIILVGPEEVHLSATTSVQAVATFTLAYNVEYTVSITATNCVGAGGTVAVNISEAGCGDPTPPVNGSIVKFTSAVVGSQLLYSCGPKLLPEGLMTSNCGLNRSWRPNPAEFKCRKPNTCVDPQPPINGSIGDYMSNVEGSVIVYFCDEGLSPEGKMNATCFSNGSWIPNPAELLCLNSHHDSEEPMSTSASVAVITVIPSVVSFIIGALVGAVVYYCVQKCYYLTTAHKEQKQVPAPVYEDIIGQTQNIELKQNVAYGPVQQ